MNNVRIYIILPEKARWRKQLGSELTIAHPIRSLSNLIFSATRWAGKIALWPKRMPAEARGAVQSFWIEFALPRRSKWFGQKCQMGHIRKRKKKSTNCPWRIIFFFQFLIVSRGFWKLFTMKINRRIRLFAHIVGHYWVNSDIIEMTYAYTCERWKTNNSCVEMYMTW